MRPFILVFALFLLGTEASAQQVNPQDVDTIESIVDATYESFARAPGENFDWDRFRTLFLPEAFLIPNTEQSQGQFKVITVQGFIDWVESVTVIGGSNDKGFAEEGYHIQIDRYGDIANAMSSYQKHYYNETEILGRGINSFQLVWNKGRWWIASIIWDETYAAGPIPKEYGGEPVINNPN